ncbi:hypothetical protein [Salinicoccus albus]|uniref:hypothetical protein n=1 Tax=Salinicoccus albus TaxID=418756 RepID=UPI0003793126|nr:hypothetical protein [Salinicoccus albus]
MMEFLYFPEDKSEYIPALIVLAICILIAYITFRLIKRYSRKQEEKMKDFEAEVLRRLEQEKYDGSRH